MLICVLIQIFWEISLKLAMFWDHAKTFVICIFIVAHVRDLKVTISLKPLFFWRFLCGCIYGRKSRWALLSFSLPSIFNFSITSWTSISSAPELFYEKKSCHCIKLLCVLYYFLEPLLDSNGTISKTCLIAWLVSFL